MPTSGAGNAEAFATMQRFAREQFEADEIAGVRRERTGNTLFDNEYHRLAACGFTVEAIKHQAYFCVTVEVLSTGEHNAVKITAPAGNVWKCSGMTALSCERRAAPLDDRNRAFRNSAIAATLSLMAQGLTEARP